MIKDKSSCIFPRCHNGWCEEHSGLRVCDEHIEWAWDEAVKARKKREEDGKAFL